ncbi:MAG: sulfatase [Kiritimatiellales bacterium]
MKRRKFIEYAGLFVAGSAVTNFSGGKQFESASGNQNPDVLVILVDELSPRCLGYAGDPNVKTPNIDRLAVEGMIFDNCYTVGPVCMPARASLISGLYPHNFDLWTNNQFWYMPPEMAPMFRDIKTAGYTTAQIGKLDWHRGRIWGKEFRDRTDYYAACGIDDFNNFQNFYSEVQPGSYREFKSREGFGEQLQEENEYWHENGEFCVVPSRIEPDQHVDSFIGMKSVEYIEKQPLNKPYCLVTSFVGPHQPFDAPGDYATKVDPETLELFPNVPDRIFFKEYWRRDEMKRIAANYYGKIMLIDDWVGNIISALEKRGTLSNTVIIFTADHGEMMGSHGTMGKGQFYDESAKVPLLIRWPGRIPPHQRTEALVQMFDVYPTVVEAIGGTLTEGHFAKSFLPIAEGRTEKIRDAVFSEYGLQQLGFMVRTERYKWFLPEKHYEGEKLFDMQNDPYEMNNLIDSPEAAPIMNRIKECHLEFFKNTQFNFSANYKSVFSIKGKSKYPYP